MRAGALVGEVAVIAARAGVHRGHQHEPGRVGERGRGPRDGDPAVLQGLAQDLEDVLSELRQLVEKEDPVVREAHLAGPRDLAAADQPGIGDRVVGTAGKAG